MRSHAQRKNVSKSGMADMTVLDYAMMVEDSHVEARIIEYRKRGVDTGITGRSATDRRIRRNAVRAAGLGGSCFS